MREIQRKKWYRFTACILCFCLLFSMSGVAYATGGSEGGEESQESEVQEDQENTGQEGGDASGGSDSAAGDPSDPQTENTPEEEQSVGQPSASVRSSARRSAAAATLGEESKYYSYNNGDEPDNYNGTWIAPGEGKVATEQAPADAATRFTVTLPAGTSFSYKEGGADFTEDTSKLRLVSMEYGALWSDFEIYRESINRHMSWHTGLDYDAAPNASTNDAQFWRLFFIDEKGQEVDLTLPEGGQAVVVVEYLQDGENKENPYPTALSGEEGTRRLCVMDMGEDTSTPPEGFTNTDEYALDTSYETNDLKKSGEYYTKLTYYYKENDGASAWGDYTALCVMKLPDAYMSGLNIESMKDGTEEFDAPEEDGKDKPGNDSADNNKIVRSFDSINYTLQFTTAQRSSEGNMKELMVAFEAVLDMDIAQARFNAASLSLFKGDPWRIEYRDKDGELIYIENAGGIYPCDKDGTITGSKVGMNDLIGGSDSAENGGAYRSRIKSQRVVAYYNFERSDGSANRGTQTVTARIDVNAAKHGDAVQPEFKMYVKGNKDNFSAEKDKNSNDVVSSMWKENEKEAEKVIVSAAARYNVVLKKNVDNSYNSYFNFTTGQEAKEGEAEAVYGRVLGYGLTLQLFNETNRTNDKGEVDGSVLADKGMKGIELPTGEISFDLTLEGTFKDGDTKQDYSAILWDYGENKVISEGEWGRNFYWKNQTASQYAKGAAPYSAGDRKQSVYSSGTWNMTAAGNGVDADGKTTGNITDTGSGVTYSFQVRGYDFDFESFTFPYQAAGNSVDEKWLLPAYIGSFSAEQIQVVQKYPENPDVSGSSEIELVVTNFQASDQSGTPVRSESAGSTNEIGGTADNKYTDTIPIYTPGSISKHNSFGSRSVDQNGNPIHGSIAEGFLGTSYWDGPSYDAYAYAGSEIYLWGAAQLARKSDSIVSAYNLLQKFDSKVLSIDTSKEILYTEGNKDAGWPGGLNETNPNKDENPAQEALGDYKFLYAADPKYPGGWDSNDEKEMDRMNEATEEDLIYFTDLNQLKAAGYTCIGVLLEVRNAEIPAGCYPGIRVPVIVSDESEGIGDTVATVNTARMWVKSPEETDINLISEVSWEAGNQNGRQADSTEPWEKNTIVNGEGEDIYSAYWNHGEVKTGDVIKQLSKDYPDNRVSYLTTDFNNYDFVKTEYDETGNLLAGTSSGYQQGMSLLVIGYESYVKLKVENTRTHESSEGLTGSLDFEAAFSDWNPLYTITGIQTKATDRTSAGTPGETTNLTICAWLGQKDSKGKKLKDDENQISVASNPAFVKSLEGDEETWIEVSEDQGAPTTVTYKKGEETVAYTIWMERTDKFNVVFHIDGALIGETLQDIRFEGQLGADIVHEAVYNAEVSISGEGDHRALTSGNGNLAQVNIKTIVLKGTTLIKSVDEKLIEQNGSFKYTVNYTNNSQEAMTQKLYMYDLMPYNGDIRNSSFTEIGNNDEEDTVNEVKVTDVSVQLGASKSGGSSGSKAYVYYSTIVQSVLRNYVDFAQPQEGQNETNGEGKDIDQLLRNALLGNDARGVYYIVNKAEFEEAKASGTLGSLRPVDIYTYDEDDPDKVTGVSDIVEYNTEDPLGTVSIKDENTYAFWNVRTGELVQAGWIVDGGAGSALEGQEIPLTLYKMFRWLGTIQPGSGNNSINSGTTVDGTDVANQMEYASCLYAVVEGLEGNTTLSLKVGVTTDANKGADVYGNIAHSWKSGDDRATGTLTSNMVSTRVVGRQIAGVVWEDVNHDGVRNSVDGTAEPLLEGVLCTLFRWDKDEGYVAVKGGDGPNGRLINYTKDGKVATFEEGDIVQMETGKDGIYGFSELPEGNYIVAFSAGSNQKFENFDGETHYQVNGGQDQVTSDGVANDGDYALGDILNADGTDLSPKDFKYYIKYDNKATSEQVKAGSNILLHTLEDMRAGKVSMNYNGVESIAYQDLGLVIDRYELPETGGGGTLPYRAAGMLFFMAGLTGMWIMWKRRVRL